MLVYKDLGFSDLILVFFFVVVVPVLALGFFVRRKWKLAVARREEIKRLLVLASEEAARAELEASVEYGAPVFAPAPAPPQFECAVCFSPTTTRCSRCKAIKYCSGKCQIIHWRLGHKDVCRPHVTPITVSHVNDFGEKAVSKDECEFSSDNLESEGIHSKEIETLKEEPVSFKVLGQKDDIVEPLFDTKATSTLSESSNGSLSSGFFTSTGTNESLVDDSVREVPVRSTSGKLEEFQTDFIAADKLESTTDVEDMEPAKPPPSEFNDSVNSVKFSFSKLKQEKSSSEAGADNHNSASASTGSLSSSANAYVPAESTASSGFWGPALGMSGDGVHYDPANANIKEDDFAQSESGSLLSSKNLARHTGCSSLSQFSKPETIKANDPCLTSPKSGTPVTVTTSSRKMVTDVSRVSSLRASSSERLYSVTDASHNDTQLSKSKTVRSLSSSASDLSSTKVENGVQIAKSGSPEVASLSSSAGNGLKTSVRKVVQQFKTSKISVYNPLGYGTEVAGKYNCKMVFPYELFLKLYTPDKLELRPFGLTNCGNSCYANAVLQCLAYTRPLTAYLLQGLHSKSCPKKEWCFSCEFEGLIQKAKEGKSPLSPIAILSQIESFGHLGRGREEDAHEFLRYAIDTMQSVCLKEAGVNAVDQIAEETTLVGLIFGGYLRSKIKCMKCRGKSERHERMMDLTVEIQGDIGTLEEALSQFTATETLDGDNKYHCGRCKSYEKAKKKLTVLEAPNILTIVLKRFQSGKFGKLNKPVQFPEILNLAPYMSGTSDTSPIYRLYAVVVHLDILNASFSGHYVCYVRNFQGKWFKIDDSTVKPVELEVVLSKGAYMLLYARFSPRAPSLIRKSMVSGDSKMRSSRRSEAVNNNGKHTSKSRSSILPSSGPAVVQRAPEGYAPWVTKDGAAGFDSWSDNSSLFSFSDEGSCSTESTRDSTSTEDLSDYIFADAGRSWNGHLGVLSDSDSSSSSLCSLSPPPNLKGQELDPPETSGYSAYITDSVPENDSIFTRRPRESIRKQNWQGKGDQEPSLLHPDTTKQCRKSINQCSSSSRCSSCRETDSKKLGWSNPFDVKSGVSLRRSARERPDQTFY